MREGDQVSGSNGGATWDMGRALIGRHSSGLRMTPQSPNEALQPDAPPPPPPRPPSRRRPTLSALSGFLSLLALLGMGALVSYVWVTNKLEEPGPLPDDRVVVISHSETRSPVDELASEGVIDSPLVMNLVLAAERKRGKVKAGEYLFKQHASLRAVIDELVNGKEVLHPITIPEGLTSAQIVQRLRENDVLTGDIRAVPKEGSLLPDTYKVARGMSRAKLLAMMQDDDRKVVDQIWARRAPDLPLHSPYDLVTLASLVEKETGKADERPRVAGVFMNRLRKHMRLQSDPTIVYGLVQGQGTLGHSITRSELDKRTPYNTYQIDGLPPGPICNPGRAALEAVANPSRTTDLYFVADGSGGHVFADTMEEHNRNVARWRQIEKDAKDKVDVDKLAPSALTPPGAPQPNGRSQRSDADLDFGALPVAVATRSDAPAPDTPKMLDPAVRRDLSVLALSENKVAPGRDIGRRGHHAAPVDPSSFAASVDGMGLSFQDLSPGGATPPRGVALLDGPPTNDVPPASSVASAAAPAPSAGSPGTRVPVVKGHQDAMLDATAQTGSQRVDLFSDPDPSAPLAASGKVPPLHPKIYDASENTAIDPLRNTSYDLNSAKSIPADLVH